MGGTGGVSGLSAGRYDKQAASLGVEKDGEKIPFFQCDDKILYTRNKIQIC